MREIKFRIWSKVFDRFLGKEEYRLDLDGGLIYVDTYNGFTNLVFTPKKEHLIEQYTGLKDKNGVEIYEGDIIRGTGHQGIVHWCKETAGFLPFIEINDYLYSGDLEDCEVIGNIHENPKSLKQ